MKRHVPTLLLLLCLMAARAERKPNIVFIMVDDMGRDWVSSYGARHQTPHIDRLAAQGVRYETAWCTPICTPTRVTLLTGQYPFRHGWTHHYDVPRWGGDGFHWDRFTTFARVVRAAGYRTVIGGKWQINDLRKHPDALDRHGFDEHCVWSGAEKGFPETEKRYWDGYIITNGRRATVRYGPDTVNDYLTGFVERNKDRPFLIYYPMMLVHAPLVPTPLTREDPPKSMADRYGAVITYMDRLVGRLVKAIDRAGLAANTLILFTCDNGSIISGSLNGKPYPKGKGKRADWGTHVPFIVRAPFLVKDPGRVSGDLIDFTDLFPTFLELAGAPRPAEVKLDGRSFLPSLRGSADDSQKRRWIYSQLGTFRMVRNRDYLLDNQGGFYRLKDDPLQERNLIESEASIDATHRDELQHVMRTFGKNAPPPFEEFVPAEVHEANKAKKVKRAKNRNRKNQPGR